MSWLRSSRARFVAATASATLPLVALVAYAAVDRYDADRARGAMRATTRAQLYAALLGDSSHGTPAPTAELSRVVDLSPPPPGSVTELLRQGALVARVGSDGAAPAAVDPALRAALSRPAGTFDDRGADRVDRVWGLAPVPGRELTVAFGIPGSAVYGAAESALRRDLAIASAVAASALAAAFLLAGRVTAPIRRLAARVGEGEGATDDIGAIERGVDRLGATIEEGRLELARRAERLESLLGEVRALNSELEGRVAVRTAQLEQANHELEAFSYSVSHDLRAPLRAIDGFSRVVIEDHAAGLDPEGRRYLGLVHENTQLMGQLIDGLLSFSRLGSQHLDKRDVDVAGIAAELAAEAERQRNGGGGLEFAIGTLPVAHADPTLLRQVFANLISNAVKYSGTRQPARVELGSSDAGGRTVYFVRDNGVGFDMRHAGKLFQVFQRLHPAEYEGTGVGLALVARIIKRHGGSIWVEAAPDAGAAFYFTLEEAA